MGHKHYISTFHCIHNNGLCSSYIHPRPGLIQSSLKLLIRRASTIDNSSANDPFYHSEWPSHKNPSPYDVLNIKKSEFDPKTLRKRYYQFAKIYHPDISKNSTLINHKGDRLCDDHKNERFKLLTNAYTLLKDEDKKNLYDQFRMGWETNEQILTRSHYRKPSPAYATQYDNYAYWNAGSWEDYQNLREDDPATRSEKMKILAALVGIIIFSATIQGWMLLNSVEKTLMETRKVHDDTEADLGLVYMNYGYDQSRISRFRRFLWFRTFGLYRDKESLDESHLENEKILKQVFGKDYVEYDD